MVDMKKENFLWEASMVTLLSSPVVAIGIAAMTGDQNSAVKWLLFQIFIASWAIRPWAALYYKHMMKN